MPMAPFQEAFPDLARAELRCLHIQGDDTLPDDSYGFFESYCDEVDCDCRRAFLNVVSMRSRKILATINYGWENVRFYRRWMSWGDADDARESKGPGLAPLAPQSKYAHRLLELFNESVLDEDYIARLARHYELFKAHVDPGYRRRGAPAREYGLRLGVRRNEPCPCGSGRKHKNCCGARVGS